MSFAGKRDFGRALLEFRNASKVMPQDAEPHYQMALALLKAGSPSNAVAELRKATELNPKHTAAQLKLADMMTTSRDMSVLQDAETRLERIVADSSPNNLEATDTLALAEWHLGKTDQAIQRLEDSLQKVPTHLQSSRDLAYVKLSQKDFDGAEEVIKKAVASAPQSVEAAVALGQLYLVLRQPENAETQFRRALELDARNASALMGIAAIQLAGNHMNDAEQTYRRLAALPDKKYKPLHALFLLRSGKTEQALAEFVKLAKDDPRDRAMRTRLFAAYIELGKMTEAQNLLAGVLKQNPEDTDALFERSELYLQCGRFAEAEKDVKEVLRFRPDSPEAHYALARAYKAQGLAATERQELNEALRINPRYLPARLALARDFMASKMAKSALDILDQAPEMQKKQPAVIVERNWALMAIGNLTEVRAMIDHWLPQSRNPELLLQDGLIKLAQHDYAGARLSADIVLRQVPGDVRAARLVVDSYIGQRQLPKALERLKAIAAANPRSAPMQHLLGQWCMNTGDVPGAQKAFEAAKAADANFSAADLALAEIDRRANRIDAAKQRLAGVIAVDPKSIPALLLLAEIENVEGNHQAAIVRYRAVLDVDGSNLLALNNLAYQLAQENPDEALKYAQHAVELAPGNATVQDTLGWVYYRKGIYNTAVGYLKAAVAKEPTPRREFHLAMSYIRSGDQELGQKTLRAALEKDPNLAKTGAAW